MSSDQIDKSILYLAIAFAIVLISVGIFKVLNSLSQSIQDLRKVLQNGGKISDFVVEDYTNIREKINEVWATFKGFSGGISEPFKFINMVVSTVSKFRKEDKNDVVK